MTDDELLYKIQASKQGHKFEALFNGQWQTYFASASEADLSLSSILLWWCRGDTVRAERLFRRSKLWRSKWESSRGAMTYGQRTMNKAGG